MYTSVGLLFLKSCGTGGALFSAFVLYFAQNESSEHQLLFLYIAFTPQPAAAERIINYF
jgi:hypothetical protein